MREHAHGGEGKAQDKAPGAGHGRMSPAHDDPDRARPAQSDPGRASPAHPDIWRSWPAHPDIWRAWPARRPMLQGLCAALVLIVGLGGWAALARLEGAVIAPARLSVQQDRQVVQHPTGGVVAELLVAEGAPVTAGAAVIRLDETQVAAELAIIDSHYLETLARIARLQAERDALDTPLAPPPLAAAMAGPGPTAAEARALFDGQVALFHARRAALRRQLARLEDRQGQTAAQLDGLATQARASQAAAQLVDHDLSVQERLVAEGLAQSARLSALRRESLQLAGAAAALEAEQARLRGVRAELAQQALALQADHQAEAEAALRDAGIRALELAERRAALRARLDGLTLRAPVSGRVHGLAPLNPGAVLQPAQPALHVVPGDHPLVLIARIRPDDIHAVHPGQPVRVQITGPGMRHAAPLQGHVAGISADVFDDMPPGAVAAGAAGAAGHFRAEIHLEPMATPPDGMALMPGMMAEVFIRTGARSALEYLTEPLRATLRRSWREP